MEYLPLEREIERHFCDRVRERGGIAEKFSKADRRGVPDRIVIMPGGKIHFVEIKRPGEFPRPDQLRIHREYAARGTVVAVLSTIDEVDAWIASVSTPPAAA